MNRISGIWAAKDSHINWVRFRFLFCVGVAFRIFWVNNHNVSFLAIRDMERGPKVAGIDWLRVPLLDADQTYIVGLILGLCLLLAGLGKAVRITLFASFCLYFFYFGQLRLIGDVYEKTNIFPFIITILALSPRVDGSLFESSTRQAIWRGNEADSVLGLSQSWPLWVIKAKIVIVFLSATWGKISNSGIDWVLSDTFKNILIWHHLWHELPLGYWLAGVDWLLPLVAGAVLLLEASAFIVLLNPRFQYVWVSGVVVFHLMTALTLGIYYINYWGFAYLVFVDDRVICWLRRRVANGQA